MIGGLARREIDWWIAARGVQTNPSSLFILLSSLEEATQIPPAALQSQRLTSRPTNTPTISTVTMVSISFHPGNRALLFLPDMGFAEDSGCHPEMKRGG